MVSVIYFGLVLFVCCCFFEMWILFFLDLFGFVHVAGCKHAFGCGQPVTAGLQPNESTGTKLRCRMGDIPPRGLAPGVCGKRSVETCRSRQENRPVWSPKKRSTRVWLFHQMCKIRQTNGWFCFRFPGSTSRAAKGLADFRSYFGDQFCWQTRFGLVFFKGLPPKIVNSGVFPFHVLFFYFLHGSFIFSIVSLQSTDHKHGVLNFRRPRRSASGRRRSLGSVTPSGARTAWCKPGVSSTSEKARRPAPPGGSAKGRVRSVVFDEGPEPVPFLTFFFLGGFGTQ